MNSEECMEYIKSMYFSDTIVLFDLVLDDDEEDPQYSAITTLNRLWAYLQYEKSLDRDYPYTNVEDLLKISGYCDEYIEQFRKKAIDERPIYHGEIFDESFMTE